MNMYICIYIIYIYYIYVYIMHILAKYLLAQSFYLFVYLCFDVGRCSVVVTAAF